MKRFIIALVVAPLCGVFLCQPALAQKTKAQLTTEIGATYPDNTGGQITPLGVRTYETDLINSIMPTAPVVSGNLACFNGTTGLLQDCGSAPATVPLTVGVTPINSAVNGNVLYANGTVLGQYSNTQLTALINPATNTLSGALPAWPNDTTKFFRGDGSYVTLNCAALSGVAASCATDTTNASNISSGTLANGRYAAVNLAAGNVNGGVTGALPLANLPTGTLDTVLGYFGSTAANAIAISNCLNALTYSTSTHTFGCNSSAGTGTVTQVICNGVTITASGTCPSLFYPTNCTLAASVASNNLTVAIKDSTGADPSASSPCYVPFRSSTLTTGSTTFLTITAATSITLNSGSTLGTTSAASFRIYAGIVNDAGTGRLVVNIPSTISSQFLQPEYSLISATACAACGTATSAQTFYANAAVSSKAWRLLGTLDWDGGLVTAGTWATGPTRIQTAPVPWPGTLLQQLSSTTTAATTDNTCNGTFNNTGLTASITLSSRINGVGVYYSGGLGSFSSGKIAYAIVNRGGTNIGQKKSSYSSTGSVVATATDSVLDLPDSTAAQTYTVGIDCDAAGSAQFTSGGTTAVMSLSEVVR